MKGYQAWTAKAVEYRVLEAAETAQTLPRGGQRQFGKAWPDYIGLYAPDLRVRVAPSARALSGMEECWAWINTILNESDRRLLYSWSWVKTRRGERIDDFASKESIKNRTLRNRVTRICHAIAVSLNRDAHVRRSSVIDDNAEILVREEPDIVAEVPTHHNHWHSPDIKPPRHQPVLYVQTAPGKRRAG